MAAQPLRRSGERIARDSANSRPRALERSMHHRGWVAATKGSYMTSSNLIDEKLAGIRGRARVQAHLLSMDATWRGFLWNATALEEPLTKSGGSILSNGTAPPCSLRWCRG